MWYVIVGVAAAVFGFLVATCISASKQNEEIEDLIRYCDELEKQLEDKKRGEE